MRILSLVLLTILAGSGPARADDVSASAVASVPAIQASPGQLRAEALDRLLAQLHVVKTAGLNAPIEAEIFKLWMASDSATAEVLLQQATAALEAGEDAPSLQLLNQVVASYPDFTEAWNKRATLYFKLGRYDESLADIDRVLALEPRHFGALAGRGMILAQQKKYAAALAALREALAINPQMSGVRDAITQIERLERPS
jgi:tetratricopeptide (TPR) repeat protein